MKIGIILFIVGLALITLLTNTKFNKDTIKNILIFVASILTLYGIVLMIQPNDDKYFDYTKTTISKQEIKTK